MSEGSLLSRIGWGAGALVVVAVLVAGAAGAGIGSLLLGGDVPPSAIAVGQIPPAMLALYQEAAITCPGLPWTVLAAIGTVESDNGQSNLPGVHSGLNSAGVAAGPMQFEPATFAQYDKPVPPGGANPPSPYDPTDAVYAAARDLCANGAQNGANLTGAVFAYNHSDSYVTEVLDLAQNYGETEAQTVAAGTAGAVALDWALAQVGTPYRWGGETPGVGFDCSGLVQAAYEAARVRLPRTAQDQYDTGPRLSPGTPLEPGDLVFFGTSPQAIEHVGLVVTPGIMVDAPHSGADVREDTFPTTLGAPFGDMTNIGATRPGAS